MIYFPKLTSGLRITAPIMLPGTICICLQKSTLLGFSVKATLTHRQTDKQTNRQTDRHTNIQTDRHTNIQTDRQIHKHTDRQTHKQTDTQTDRHTTVSKVFPVLV